MRNHLIMYHGLGGVVLDKTLDSLPVQLLTNRTYTSPGSLRVEALETEKLQVPQNCQPLKAPDTMQCQFVLCGYERTSKKVHQFDMIKDMRLHWQNEHTELTQKFRCPQCLKFKEKNPKKLLSLKGIHMSSQHPSVMNTLSEETWNQSVGESAIESRNSNFVSDTKAAWLWRDLLGFGVDYLKKNEAVAFDELLTAWKHGRSGHTVIMLSGPPGPEKDDLAKYMKVSSTVRNQSEPLPHRGTPISFAYWR